MAKKSISIRQNFIMTIVVVGIACLALLASSNHLYRQFAFENERTALKEMIHAKIAEILEDLSDSSKDMGAIFYKDKRLQEALQRRDTTVITKILNNQFAQYYTTAGVLKLEKLYAFDREHRLISRADGNVTNSNSKIFLCSKLLNKARNRSGADKLKYLSDVCLEDGNSYYGVLIPYGGLRPHSYLLIVTDPTYNLQRLEAALNNPIRITQASGEVAYVSPQWPTDNLLESHLLVSHSMHDATGDQVFSVSLARDSTAFLTKLEKLNIILLIVVCLISALAIITTLFFLRRAFNPIVQLQQASEKLIMGEYGEVAATSCSEVDMAIDSFNAMVNHISSLISKLEGEINFRETIQNQLFENQKSLEEARDQAVAASRFKSDFLANMSHEIRTPLTAIIGFAESYHNTNQTLEERVEATKIIISSGKHLLQLINDILDLSKIEAAKLEFEHAEFSIFQLLSSVESYIKLQVENKGLEFRIIYEFPLPETISSDYLRVKQVLLNLCSNAVKFTDAGYVHVYVRCDREQEKLYFKVVDTGIGLSEDQLSTIFEAFKQADSSITRKYGGTGLGLSLSQQLVSHLGGSIEVKSTYNAGSQFTVSFATGPLHNRKFINNPVEIPNVTESPSSVAMATKLQGDVLIAEDNKNNQKLLTVLLKHMGEAINVDIVENGQDAVNQANRNHYDVILMDMQMPIMGGLEATEKLRNTGYNKPIVALTANAMAEHKQQFQKAGCNDFLSKPIDRKQLFNVVSRYLKSFDVQEDSPIYPKLDNDDPVEYLDIIESFIADLQKNLPTIIRAHETGDIATAHGLMHQIKGLGGSLGFPMVSQLAAKIEYQFKNKDRDAARSLLEEMKSVASRLRLPGNEKSSVVQLRNSQPRE